MTAPALNPNVVRIPAGLPADVRKAIIAANPSAVFADGDMQLAPGLVTTDVSTQQTVVHGGTLSTILKIVRGIADTGLPILLPGILGPALDAGIDMGIDEAIAKLDSASVEERWTLNKIAEARAAVAEPTT